MDEERKIVNLVDENGEQHTVELLDFVDYEEKTYGIFTPYDPAADDAPEDDDEEIEAIVFEIIEEGEGISLEGVADPKLCEKVLKAFTEQVALYELEDEEE